MKKQSKGKYANLSLKKRKKHTEMNGNGIIKKSEEADFETAKVKRRKKTNTESIIIDKSKKFDSELAEMKGSKRAVFEAAEIEGSEMGGESACVPSNTTISADGSFDPSKLRGKLFYLSKLIGKPFDLGNLRGKYSYFYRQLYRRKSNDLHYINISMRKLIGKFYEQKKAIETEKMLNEVNDIALLYVI